MADRLRLEVATPTRLVVSSEADEVVAPGTEGYFGVLPGHAAFLTTLASGELTYRQGRDELAGGSGELQQHYLASRILAAFSCASSMPPTM